MTFQVLKRRTRRTKKFTRAVEGLDMDALMKKRNQTAEVCCLSALTGLFFRHVMVLYFAVRIGRKLEEYSQRGDGCGL